MAIEQINLGTVVQDGADGDVARVAFTKVNANFADLESRKVEKVTGKRLSTEDYTTFEKSKLAGIESGAQVNTVTSVAGKTGAVALVKGDVGLGNVDNTSDANKPISTATQTALNLKANASTQIIAGTGLTGGGTLDTNRTLAVSYGTTAGTSTQGNDSRLSDVREWSAETVSQAEAEAGTATTRRAWTAQRVRQAIVAWWNGVSSAWGRGFVASFDAAAGRTALELGNAATANVATNAEAIAGTAGVLPDADGVHAAFGKYGLGSKGSSFGNNFDFNSQAAFIDGSWRVEGGTVNGPVWSDYCQLRVTHATGDTLNQTIYDYNKDRISFRSGVLTSGSYYDIRNRPWCEIFHTGNILGPVAQSGGIPTGAIIERGSNANGEFVRFADGTQMCFFVKPVGQLTQWSYNFRNFTWPAPFAAVPVISVSLDGIGNPGEWFTMSAEQRSTSGFVGVLVTSSTTSSPTLQVIAIGRWF